LELEIRDIEDVSLLKPSIYVVIFHVPPYNKYVDHAPFSSVFRI